MQRQFKLARQFKYLKVTEAAERLGVSQPTLSSWEGERKSPSIDNLENMANLYEVTTDFLLGRTEKGEIINYTSEPIPYQLLTIYHGKPLWSPRYGWMLADAVNRLLISVDRTEIPFADAGKLYSIQPELSETSLPERVPLSKSELYQCHEVWLEPISSDTFFRNELRGWYKVKARWVENEFGNRFYFDVYGSKWLAFDENGR